jgi:hypothetical protein
MLSDNQKLLLREAMLDGKRLALRLYSFSAAKIPTVWAPDFAELVRADLFAFALTARRTLELARLEKRTLRFTHREPHVEREIVSKVPDYNYEYNFSDAVNYIIHSSNLIVQRVDDSENAMSRLVDFISETDRKQRAAVNIISFIIFYFDDIYPKANRMLSTSDTTGSMLH